MTIARMGRGVVPGGRSVNRGLRGGGQACKRHSAVRHFGAARLGEQRAQVARGAGARAERNAL